MIDFDFSHRNSFSMDGVMESLTGPVAKLLIYDALTMAVRLWGGTPRTAPPACTQLWRV